MNKKKVVKDAWNNLDPSVIRNGFLKCCISNALDGSEDDILWREGDDESILMEDDDGDIYYDGENTELSDVEVILSSEDEDDD